MDTDSQTLLDLVGEIYEAAWVPDHWDEVMARLCSLLNAKSAVLAYEDYQGKFRTMLGAYGIPKVARLGFRFGLAKYDVPFQLQLNQPEGKARQILNMKAQKDEHPLYYRLLAKPNDICFLAAVSVFNDAHWHVGVGVHRGFDDAPFSDEALQQLQRLHPHFQRALRIHREFHRLRHERQTLASTLARLMLGVIILDEQQNVLYANPVAHTFINQHGGLALHDNRLSACNAEEHTRLQHALHTLQQADPADIHTRHIALGFHHPQKTLPLTAMLATLNELPEHLHHFRKADAVVMYLSDPDASANLPEHSLCHFYNLTPAEAHVATALVNGLSSKEISIKNAVSIETVRSQLKAIYRKLGANTQQDVIRILLHSSYIRQA